MSWKNNAILYVSADNGTSWDMLTDHNREPLDITFKRIEKTQRMANGTLRRYSVAKKKSVGVSWKNLPSRRNPSYAGKTGITTVDDGWAGEDIELFYNNNDGPVIIKLRGGDDESKAITDGTIEIVNVLITDFSKTITKRGVVDFWDLSITFEEI